MGRLSFYLIGILIGSSFVLCDGQQDEIILDKKLMDIISVLETRISRGPRR